MFPIERKKTDAINGVILFLANKYDVDCYPIFHNKRSINKVLKWMQFYKMKIKDVFVLRLAFDLTYSAPNTACSGQEPHR